MTFFLRYPWLLLLLHRLVIPVGLEIRLTDLLLSTLGVLFSGWAGDSGLTGDSPIGSFFLGALCCFFTCMNRRVLAEQRFASLSFSLCCCSCSLFAVG